jgi:hypothetical protein
MAAVLSNQGGYYRPHTYIAECRRMGLLVEGPDINASRWRYYGLERRVKARDIGGCVGQYVRLLGWPITQKEVWTVDGLTMSFLCNDDGSNNGVVDSNHLYQRSADYHSIAGN